MVLSCKSSREKNVSPQLIEKERLMELSDVLVTTKLQNNDEQYEQRSLVPMRYGLITYKYG